MAPRDTAIRCNVFAPRVRGCIALCGLMAWLFCGGGLFAARASDGPSTQSGRHQLLVYYADETTAQAAQSENYAALLTILRGSSSPLAATLLAGIISDAEKFPLLVRRDIDALELQAKRLGFDVAIFTNALAFEGHYLWYRAETGTAETRALPAIPPTSSTILATSPISRPESLHAALFSVSALYPTNSLDIVLIINGHGGSDMALIPRVNADLSQPGAAAAMREMLASGDEGAAPAWAIPQGISKLAYWQILDDASSTFGVRFPLVFREACFSGLRSWTEFFAVPRSVGLIADSGGEDLNSWDFDYAQMLGTVSPGSDWIASLAAALEPHGIHINTRSTAWIGVLLITLQRIPIAAFFAPLVLWLAWYAVATFRRRRVLGIANSGLAAHSVPGPQAKH
jgi:hypothetical protein